jgi:hypothetical protein
MTSYRVNCTVCYQSVISQLECYSLCTALATPYAVLPVGTVAIFRAYVCWCPCVVCVPRYPGVCSHPSRISLQLTVLHFSTAIASDSSGQCVHDVSGQASGPLPDHRLLAATPHARRPWRLGGASRGCAAAQRWDRRTACSGAALFGHRRVDGSGVVLC